MTKQLKLFAVRPGEDDDDDKEKTSLMKAFEKVKPFDEINWASYGSDSLLAEKSLDSYYDNPEVDDEYGDDPYPPSIYAPGPTKSNFWTRGRRVSSIKKSKPIKESDGLVFWK